METKASKDTDLVISVMSFVFLNMHAYIPTAIPPPPPPFGLTSEWPLPMGWPLGELAGKHEFASRVLHKGRPIAQEGHDCGPLIPHYTVAPPAPSNANDIVSTLKSSRKVMFSAGEVVLQGKPVAHAIALNLPPTPMMSCSEPINMPIGCATASWLNSLVIGVHWVDLLAGWLEIAADMLISILTQRARPTQAATSPQSFLGALESDAGKHFDFRSGADAASDNTGIVTGLVRLGGQRFGGYAGDAKVEMNLGAPGIRVRVGYESSGVDGSTRATGRLEGSLPYGAASGDVRGTYHLSGEAEGTGSVEARSRFLAQENEPVPLLGGTGQQSSGQDANYPVVEASSGEELRSEGLGEVRREGAMRRDD